MKLISFLCIVIVTAFIFAGFSKLHPLGQPIGSKKVFEARTDSLSDTGNVLTIDDYYLRNGQIQTGSNNIVTSVVFDYRGFDTLGEASVLFIVVTSITMLLYNMIKPGKTPDEIFVNNDGYPLIISRIVTIGTILLLPIIAAFGSYVIIHGHLSPGGGFQGGAILATGTAMLIVSSYMTKKLYPTYNIFSLFESIGLTAFIVIGFAGFLGYSFLYNFLANGNPLFFGKTIELGSNPGFLNSGGIIPLLSLAVGLEVFCGISIILILLNRALYLKKTFPEEK